MRPRTNKALLDRLVERVNKLTGNPLETWSVGEWNEATQSVSVKANIGNIFVSPQYNNKYQIQQIDTPGGGVALPLGSDHLSARETEIQLRAYIAGLEKK